jgi:hypothetical protein
MYPAEAVGSERMRDAMYAMYAIFGVAGFFSVVWFFAWRAFWRNKKRYASAVSRIGGASDLGCPLFLDGDILLVNRGFSVQEIDIHKVRWFHSGRILSRVSRPMYLEIHLADGGKSIFLIEAKYIPSVDNLIDKVAGGRPRIMVSRGHHFSSAYRDCKRRYRLEK